jgi:hypothetical protein
VLNPTRALLSGPCGVIPKELTNVRCRNIDVEIDRISNADSDDNLKDVAKQVIAELQSDAIESPVAYRKNRRWVQTFKRTRDPGTQPSGAGDASSVPSAPPTSLKYVALGDSYVAAPLVPVTDVANGCFRSSAHYPSICA